MTDQELVDTRIVAGSRCTWWDNIQKAGTTATGLPCCPYCKSALYQWDDEYEFVASITARADEDGVNHIDALDRTSWLKGKCLLSMECIDAVYKEIVALGGPVND